MKNIEGLSNAEHIPDYSSKIDLRFFRHDEKESDPTKSDSEIRLTPKGRVHAKFQAEKTNLAQSVAYGSPRKRAQETAGLIMTGAEDMITGEESLEDLKAKINGGLQHGTKLGVDPRLNFDMESDNEYVKEAITAFKKGELMKFLVEKSDQLAEETGDTTSSTYSRMAASVASIIKKYVGIAPRWDALVHDETKEYEPVLKRFFGTHQSIQESFLAKVIETMKGAEERDRFIQAIKNKGFDYSEGCEVEIVTKSSGEEPVVHVSYKKEGKTPEEIFEFNEDVSLELIDAIAEPEKATEEV